MCGVAGFDIVFKWLFSRYHTSAMKTTIKTLGQRVRLWVKPKGHYLRQVTWIKFEIRISPDLIKLAETNSNAKWPNVKNKFSIGNFSHCRSFEHLNFEHWVLFRTSANFMRSGLLRIYRGCWAWQRQLKLTWLKIPGFHFLNKTLPMSRQNIGWHKSV